MLNGKEFGWYSDGRKWYEKEFINDNYSYKSWNRDGTLNSNSFIKTK